MLLEQAGYGRVSVTDKGPRGGDGGVDLTIHDNAGRLVCVAQCKRWKTRPASGLMRIIRELAGSMSRRQVTRGLLLITAPATRFEKQEAEILGIMVIDVGFLARMLGDADGSPDQATRGSSTATLPSSARMSPGERLYQIMVWSAGIAAVVLMLAVVYHYRQVILAIIAIALLAAVSETPRRRRYRQRFFGYRQRSRRRW